MVILPADVGKVDARPLSCAFDRSFTHTLPEWIERCKRDLAQLWQHGELLAVTEVLNTKTGRALHIVAMAGVFDQALMTEMETWGKSQGCTYSIFTGRRGWTRRLPDYSLKTVTMVKGL